MRLSKGFQYGTAETVGRFSPCGVINGGQEEKVERGCLVAWKNARDRSAGPRETVSRSVRCRKRGNQAEPRSPSPEEDEGLGAGSAGEGRAPEAALPAGSEEQEAVEGNQE